MLNIRSMLNEESLQLFWYFIHHRQSIWYSRYIHRQDPPWTDDPVISIYKFTNVYRMLDRGTLYLHNVMYPAIDSIEADPFMNGILKWTNTVFYRFYNKIHTMGAFELGIPVRLAPHSQDAITRIQRCLYAWEQEGNGLFTNAHMVNSIKSWKVEPHEEISPYGMDSKSNRFLKGFKNTLDNAAKMVQALMKAKTGREAFYLIKGCAPGIGEFVAYEIFCDLVYTKVLPQFDENDFVNIGPGAGDGLHVLSETYGNDRGELLGLAHVDFLWENQVEFFQKYGLDFLYFQFPGYFPGLLSKRCIEHSLCEFYKYHRTLNGNGRPRNGYTTDASRIDALRATTQSYVDLINSGLTLGFKVAPLSDILRVNSFH